MVDNQLRLGQIGSPVRERAILRIRVNVMGIVCYLDAKVNLLDNIQSLTIRRHDRKLSYASPVHKAKPRKQVYVLWSNLIPH